VVERLGVAGKAFLCLSGTPFRAIASLEFRKEQIYNWTYTDEQRAKEAFASRIRVPGANTSATQMHLLVYKLPRICAGLPST